jgi:hypothetical protein
MARDQWKDELRGVLDEHFISSGEEIFDLVMPHIEAAYKRGHEAGSSRAGYRLVQENERLRRALGLLRREQT